MYVSISPINGAPGKYSVGYLLPTNYGVLTTKGLSESLVTYQSVIGNVTA
jgi:hypothetical protein